MEEMEVHRPPAFVLNKGCLCCILRALSSGLAVVISRLMFVWRAIYNKDKSEICYTTLRCYQQYWW